MQRKNDNNHATQEIASDLKKSWLDLQNDLEKSIEDIDALQTLLKFYIKSIKPIRGYIHQLHEGTLVSIKEPGSQHSPTVETPNDYINYIERKITTYRSLYESKMNDMKNDITIKKMSYDLHKKLWGLQKDIENSIINIDKGTGKNPPVSEVEELKNLLTIYVYPISKYISQLQDGTFVKGIEQRGRGIKNPILFDEANDCAEFIENQISMCRTLYESIDAIFNKEKGIKIINLDVNNKTNVKQNDIIIARREPKKSTWSDWDFDHIIENKIAEQLNLAENDLRQMNALDLKKPEKNTVKTQKRLITTSEPMSPQFKMKGHKKIPHVFDLFSNSNPLSKSLDALPVAAKEFDDIKKTKNEKKTLTLEDRTLEEKPLAERSRPSVFFKKSDFIPTDQTRSKNQNEVIISKKIKKITIQSSNPGSPQSQRLEQPVMSENQSPTNNSPIIFALQNNSLFKEVPKMLVEKKVKVILLLDCDGTLTLVDGPNLVHSEFYDSLYKTGNYQSDGIFLSHEDVIKKMRSEFSFSVPRDGRRITKEAVRFLINMLNKSNIHLHIAIITHNYPEYIQSLLVYEGFDKKTREKITILNNGCKNDLTYQYLRSLNLQSDDKPFILICEDNAVNCQKMEACVKNYFEGFNLSKPIISTQHKKPGDFTWSEYGNEIEKYIISLTQLEDTNHPKNEVFQI